jgi:hypothetical protein
MALPCVPAARLSAAPPASLGKAAGVLNTAQQFGAVLGIAVVTAVFNASGSLASPAAVTSGYRGCPRRSRRNLAAQRSDSARYPGPGPARPGLPLPERRRWPTTRPLPVRRP